MRTRVEFTFEGLQRTKSHVQSELSYLPDEDLKAIQSACQGGRTRNASMLLNISDCGESDVLQLWEHESGRHILVEVITEIFQKRAQSVVTKSLWRNVEKLA